MSTGIHCKDCGRTRRDPNDFDKSDGLCAWCRLHREEAAWHKEQPHNTTHNDWLDSRKETD